VVTAARWRRDSRPRFPADLRHVAGGKGFELIDKGRVKVPALFEILRLARIRMQLQPAAKRSALSHASS
jgi:hypothetical protein